MMSLLIVTISGESVQTRSSYYQSPADDVRSVRQYIARLASNVLTQVVSGGDGDNIHGDADTFM